MLILPSFLEAELLETSTIHWIGDNDGLPSFLEAELLETVLDINAMSSSSPCFQAS
jgi:hypothetical protein